MSEHHDPYSVAARLLLSAALTTLQGGIQMLGAFVTLLRGSDPGLFMDQVDKGF